MPPFVHFLGPAHDKGEGSAAHRLLRRLELTQELVRNLPPHDVLSQKMHHGTGDLLGFQSLSFRSAVQFTFELPPMSHEEVMAAGAARRATWCGA